VSQASGEILFCQGDESDDKKEMVKNNWAGDRLLEFEPVLAGD
jgi:hypothetical protein